MQLSENANAYSLYPLDVAIMGAAGIRIHELMQCTPKQPGLPPLWSRMPYLLLLQSHQANTKLFWKAYREFDVLLKNTDQHYTPAYIPKNNGKTRALMIPDQELRYHQRFIQESILNKLPVSEHAYAYRKHRGLTDLATPHIGHETLIHLDIKDFFSSITEQTVFENLYRETGYPKAVAGFLSRLCCYRNRLPQGACTSPVLSNICFLKCDEEIAELAKHHVLAYSRYSDDLFLSGDGVDANAVIRAVKAILAKYGFRLQSDKTRVLGRHQAQAVTAIVVNDKLQVSRAYRRKLRQELHYVQRYREDAKDSRSAESYPGYLYQLLGKVSFVLYVDPNNREFVKARNMLEQMVFPYRHPDLPF